MRFLYVTDRHRFLYSQKRDPQLPTPPQLCMTASGHPPLEVSGGGDCYGIKSKEKLQDQERACPKCPIALSCSKKNTCGMPISRKRFPKQIYL